MTNPTTCKRLCKGQLFPCDGVEGCLFEVEKLEEACKVKLFSASTGEVLEEKTMPISDVGQWLYDHRDW